jgi:hypothetical protein
MATTAPDRDSASWRRASSAFRATPADGPGGTFDARSSAGFDDGFGFAEDGLGFARALGGMAASRFIRAIVLDGPRRRDSRTT